MPNYLNQNNESFTEQEIANLAESNEMSFDDYVKLKGLTVEVKEVEELEDNEESFEKLKDVFSTVYGSVKEKVEDVKGKIMPIYDVASGKITDITGDVIEKIPEYYKKSKKVGKIVLETAVLIKEEEIKEAKIEETWELAMTKSEKELEDTWLFVDAKVKGTSPDELNFTSLWFHPNIGFQTEAQKNIHFEEWKVSNPEGDIEDFMDATGYLNPATIKAERAKEQNNIKLNIKTKIKQIILV